MSRLETTVLFPFTKSATFAQIKDEIDEGEKGKGIVRKKANKKKQNNETSSTDGCWEGPHKIALFLTPIFLLVFINGFVSHYWLWKPAHAFYQRQFGQALQRMGLHEKAAIMFKRSLKTSAKVVNLTPAKTIIEAAMINWI